MAEARIVAANESYYTLELTLGDVVVQQTICTLLTGPELGEFLQAYAAEYEAALTALTQG